MFELTIRERASLACDPDFYAGLASEYAHRHHAGGLEPSIGAGLISMSPAGRTKVSGTSLSVQDAQVMAADRWGEQYPREAAFAEWTDRVCGSLLARFAAISDPDRFDIGLFTATTYRENGKPVQHLGWFQMISGGVYAWRSSNADLSFTPREQTTLSPAHALVLQEVFQPGMAF